MRKQIGILGGGVWGSALAKLLSSNDVLIFVRDKKILSSINEFKINPKLKYVIFNDNVTATSDILQLKKCDYLLIALPTQFIREAGKLYGKCENHQQVIICSKGIEIDTKLFPSDIIKSVFNTSKISILSGPNFSVEITQNLPTAATLATKDRKVFDDINLIFNNNNFRLYYSDDLIGSQIGGALKNIYAIAVGITMGLNLGDNAKSALITRSFAEIVRFANKFGAKTNTLYGLSGLGDLILTCNSLKSRNTSFGQLISSQQKISISDHLKTNSTTEGYFTIQAVKLLSEEKKISMPIADAVYRILFKKSSIQEEIEALLNRPAVKEYDE